MNLVRSELRKIFTTRLWWGLLLGLMAAWAALSVLVGGVGLRSGTGPTDPAGVRSVYTAGLGVAYLFTLAFGVISMAGEYRQQTITATLLAAPRRPRVVLAKLVAVAVVGIGYGVAGVLAGIAAAVPTLAGHGTVSLTADDLPRTLVAAAVAVGLWAVIGLGVGTLIRNQVVALLVAIGVSWIADPVIGLVLDAAGYGSVARFLPSRATSALTDPATTSGGTTLHYLPWWGGAVVLLTYAVVAGALGAVLTLRRDIT